MNDTAVTDLGTTVLAAGALLGLVFALVYTLLAKWWRTREGWYLVMSSLVLAAVLSYNFAAVVGWLDVEDRPWVRLAIYTTALGVMLWRGVLLIQAQHELWQINRSKRK